LIKPLGNNVIAHNLVPSGANLLPAYGSFTELEEACRAFCDRVNA
jgi:hypothetical protein